MKNLKLLQAILMIAGFIVLFVCFTNAQTTPSVFVNANEISAFNLSSGSPVWLSEGQTLGTGTKVVTINVLQFIKASSVNGGYELKFDTPLIITDPSSSPATVPSGTVWKVESVGLDKTASATMGDNLGNHVATTDLNLSAYKVFNLGNPVSLGDAVNATTLQKGNLVYASDIGTANSYSVNLSPAPLAYSPGMIVNLKVANANTGASTINVNALGPKSIKKQVNVDLIANELAPNQLVSLIYDGTNFQMISPVATSSGIAAANLFSATAWQSSNTSSNWENINTISYTIPQTGLYQVICSYESEAGTGGTSQNQRLMLGSYVGNQASVVGAGYQFRTISNMANLSSGAVIYLQNQNDWNYGYKNTVKNIQFSIIKLN